MFSIQTGSNPRLFVLKRGLLLTTQLEYFIKKLLEKNRAKCKKPVDQVIKYYTIDLNTAENNSEEASDFGFNNPKGSNGNPNISYTKFCYFLELKRVRLSITKLIILELILV